jgi:hypothetical protein
MKKIFARRVDPLVSIDYSMVTSSLSKISGIHPFKVNLNS